MDAIEALMPDEKDCLNALVNFGSSDDKLMKLQHWQKENLGW